MTLNNTIYYYDSLLLPFANSADIICQVKYTESIISSALIKEFIKGISSVYFPYIAEIKKNSAVKLVVIAPSGSIVSDHSVSAVSLFDQECNVRRIQGNIIVIEMSRLYSLKDDEFMDLFFSDSGIYN